MTTIRIDLDSHFKSENPEALAHLEELNAFLSAVKQPLNTVSNPLSLAVGKLTHAMKTNHSIREVSLEVTTSKNDAGELVHSFKVKTA